MLLGHFAVAVWVYLNCRVTANQYKVLLTDHLYHTMSISCLIDAISSRMATSSSTRPEGSMIGLMCLKMI